MSHAENSAKVIPLTRLALEAKERFSERDIIILHGLREGLTDREIAETLGLREETVHYHMRHLIARNRTHAVIQAMQKNWIRLDG